MRSSRVRAQKHRRETRVSRVRAAQWLSCCPLALLHVAMVRRVAVDPAGARLRGTQRAAAAGVRAHALQSSVDQAATPDLALRYKRHSAEDAAQCGRPTRFLMSQYNALVRKAFQSQTTLDNNGEHCSADFRKLASIGARLGQQVRIKRSTGDFALYTVSEGSDESPDEIVRMAAVARTRLRGGDAFDAVVETQAIRSDISDEQADQAGEFVERLDDDDASSRFIVMAPHGGAIEPFTAEQAERVHDQLESRRVSSWRCKGFKGGGGAQGAHERWHITSTDIDERSFPLLRRIADRLFAHAVS